MLSPWAWKDGAIRFVSDPKMREYARRAAETASDGVRRAQMVGYVRAMSDPRVIADLQATSACSKSVRNARRTTMMLSCSLVSLGTKPGVSRSITVLIPPSRRALFTDDADLARGLEDRPLDISEM